MRRILAAFCVLLGLTLTACSLYEPGTVIVIHNGTTAAPTAIPVATTPAPTTPAATIPAATTPGVVGTTPRETTPAATSAVTTPAATPPAETAPAVTTPAGTTPAIDWSATRFVVNTNTKRIHVPTCRYADQIKAENRKEVVGTAEFTEEYTPCKVCLPDLTLE